MNVHKTFRRRPGHLLNVLCTFNLRPVFTGFIRDVHKRWLSKDVQDVFWISYVRSIQAFQGVALRIVYHYKISSFCWHHVKKYRVKSSILYVRQGSEYASDVLILPNLLASQICKCIIDAFTQPHALIWMHKKWSFPWRISSVNMTKSAVSCGVGHIYWRNPSRKTSFFVHWYGQIVGEITTPLIRLVFSCY